MARLIPGHPIKVTLEDGSVVMVPQDPSVDMSDRTKAKKIYTRRALAQHEAYLQDKQEADDRYEADKNPVHAMVGDEVYGAGETIASLGSSILGAVPGMAYGIATGDVEEGLSKFTYSPRSKAGQRNVAAVGEAIDDSKLAGLPPMFQSPTRVAGKNIKRTKKSAKEIPTRTQIKERATKAYRAADEAGAVVKTSDFAKFAKQIQETLRRKGFRAGNADLTSIKSIVDEIKVLSKKKGGVTLQDLQDLRELAGGALSKADDQTNMLGNTAVHGLDDFLDTITTGKLKKGNSQSFAQWRLGRQLWRQQAKLKEMEWMQTKAGLKSLKPRNPKDGEAMEKFRNSVIDLLANEKKIKRWNKTEQQLMRDFADGGSPEKVLGFLQGFSPSSAHNIGQLATVPGSLMLGGMPWEIAAGAAGVGAGVGKASAFTRARNMRGRGENLMEGLAIGNDPLNKYKYGINLGEVSSTPLAVGAGLLDGVRDVYSGQDEEIENADVDF